MRCKYQMENSSCWIVQKLLYSPNRTNRSNRLASLVSLKRCKCQMENSTCRMVQNISNCQIERIGQIKLLFSPIESSWQYWTTLAFSPMSCFFVICFCSVYIIFCLADVQEFWILLWIIFFTNIITACLELSSQTDIYNS